MHLGDEDPPARRAPVGSPKGTYASPSYAASIIQGNLLYTNFLASGVGNSYFTRNETKRCVTSHYSRSFPNFSTHISEA
jgi:hypothetical protein